jgi:hypothetical protein
VKTKINHKLKWRSYSQPFSVIKNLGNINKPLILQVNKGKVTSRGEHSFFFRYILQRDSLIKEHASHIWAATLASSSSLRKLINEKSQADDR